MVLGIACSTACGADLKALDSPGAISPDPERKTAMICCLGYYGQCGAETDSVQHLCFGITP